LLFEHNLFRKPASTFRDHALNAALDPNARRFRYLPSFALDRQAARADVDMDTLGLMATATASAPITR